MTAPLVYSGQAHILLTGGSSIGKMELRHSGGERMFGESQLQLCGGEITLQDPRRNTGPGLPAFASELPAAPACAPCGFKASRT
jgi:hypothetical protein